ncbi:hypothetical protein HU200_030705 [Digitaria exilis]|uniref:Non-structural maintenance of chromosomes element 1 homolog n=1 Tax=Digitaria exilis TaxID=1010633 RepID=A0A835EQK1_9POAL|nr:hypothetical protein HU200_030705 [Digitaria exilis]
MAPLTWRHHTLLQALLTRGPLSEREFHDVFAAVSGKKPGASVISLLLFSCAILFSLRVNGPTQQVFDEMHLCHAGSPGGPRPFLSPPPSRFELRACINQYDGMVYYGIVNNIADEESKLGTKYSVAQIAFYKGLLEAILHETGNDGSITSIDALNVRLDNQVIIVDGSQDSQSRLPTSIKNFSFSQKEKTLNELIQDRWLSNTSTGKIGLGTRSFLDLRSWFRSNDIPSCVVCNEACIKASGCPNEGCNVRIHEYCLRKKFSQRKASRACPGCGTEWPRQDGEADGDDNVNEPGEDEAPSANRSSKKRRKRVKAELVEENNNAGPSTAVLRRTLRSAKAEAVEAAQEASSAGASQATRASKRRKE